MRTVLLIIAALLLPAEKPAEAGKCPWIKRREFVRYQVERAARQRLSKVVNGKLQEFFDALSADERADIRSYASPGADRTATLLKLRRRLMSVASGFNTARCAAGVPVYDDGYPSKLLCAERDESAASRPPRFFRSVRLFAHAGGLFVEGEMRQDSRKRLIQAHGSSAAGDYFVRVTMGDPEDETRQLADAAAEFAYDDFDDFLAGDDGWPTECR